MCVARLWTKRLHILRLITTLLMRIIQCTHQNMYASHRIHQGRRACREVLWTTDNDSGNVSNGGTECGMTCVLVVPSDMRAVHNRSSTGPVQLELTIGGIILGEMKQPSHTNERVQQRQNNPVASLHPSKRYASRIAK